MKNFLKFPNNSQLSNTDDARISRLEGAFPTPVAGRIRFSSSAFTVPGSGAVTSSGAIAPTGIKATGSTFAFVTQGNFAFTSDGSSITLHWDGSNASKLLAIRRADGSNFSVPAGSMKISGLTTGMEYGFSPFSAIAQSQNLSFVQGDSGAPQFAFSPGATVAQLDLANRTQRLTTNERITEGPIYFTCNVGASGMGTGSYTGR